MLALAPIHPGQAPQKLSSRANCVPKYWNGPRKRHPMGPRIGRSAMAAVLKVNKNLIVRI